MSATREISLRDSIALAVEQLPPVRRAAMRVRLRSQRYRERIEAELAECLCDDPDCPNICPAFVAMGSSDLFAATAAFAIDIDQIERWIQLILKYLPQIIQLISVLF